MVPGQTNRDRLPVLLVLLGGLAGSLLGCSPCDLRGTQTATEVTLPATESPAIPSRLTPAYRDEGAHRSSALPPASAPQWISYPAAGIDLSVVPLTPSADDLADGSLVPPMTTDAFWLTPYGQPGSGSDNTAYIIGHSWENGEAPFNRLSSHSAVGDELSVSTATGRVNYKVQTVTTHDKNTLRTSDVWNRVSGRLVLISCYAEDIWGKNVIVTAMPVP